MTSCVTIFHVNIKKTNNYSALGHTLLSKPHSPADGNGWHQLLGPAGWYQQDGLGSGIPPFLLLTWPQELHSRVDVAGQARLGRGSRHGSRVRTGLPYLGGDPAGRVSDQAVEGFHENTRASRGGVPSGDAVVLGCHVRRGLWRGAPGALG